MESLYVAAHAYGRLAGPSRCIDLIILRRKRGNLQSTSPASPVSNVPTEVWSKIRKHLIEEELVHSQTASLLERLCPGHERGFLGPEFCQQTYMEIIRGCTACHRQAEKIRWRKKWGTYEKVRC